MTRQTTSRARFTRNAAEVAAEASEDALARDVAARVLHPRPRPRKPAPRAVWAAHAVVVSGLIGGALTYPPAAAVCSAAAVVYLAIAGGVHRAFWGPAD